MNARIVLGPIVLVLLLVCLGHSRDDSVPSGADIPNRQAMLLSDCGSPAVCGDLSCAGGGPARLTRWGGDNRWVLMDTNHTVLQFDTWYGGAPLGWYRSGTPIDPPRSIIYYHAGAGFQVTYETGQDSTQAGATGLDEYRIARLDQGSNPQDYYIRETKFQAPGDTRTPAVYEVTGFTPFFWISHQAPDDSIPIIRRGGVESYQDGWVTLYNPQGRPSTDFQNVGAPIWFKGSADRPSGILMVGNEMKPIPTDPFRYAAWNRRLVEIKEGRVAFKVRISLKDASPGAIGGIMFRRDISPEDRVTMDDAYLSSGYFLNVNTAGRVELLRANGAGQILLVWGHDNIAPQVNTPAGALLEVRTRNDDPGMMQIWVDNVHRDDYDYRDPNPLRGPHVGLFAQAGPNPQSQIKFFERQVFDVGLEMVATYSGYSDGRILSSTIVRNASGVTIPHTFYRVNLVAFLNTGGRPELNTVWTEDARGQRLDPATQSGSYLPRLLGRCGDPPPARCASSLPYALWAGAANGSLGVYGVPTRADIDGAPAKEPHALLQAPNTILHLNALDPGANNNPISATHIRLDALWRTAR